MWKTDSVTGTQSSLVNGWLTTAPNDPEMPVSLDRVGGDLTDSIPSFQLAGDNSVELTCQSDAVTVRAKIPLEALRDFITKSLDRVTKREVMSNQMKFWE